MKENEIKPNKETVEAILQLKQQETPKKWNLSSKL